MTQVSFEFPIRASLRHTLGAERRSPLSFLNPAGAHRGSDRPADRPADDAVAFEIGRDHAHHGLTPPGSHLSDGHPIRAGWDAGRASFGVRTLKASDPVRAWLSLRMQAWLTGVTFDTCHVTPHLIERLQPAQCPVTREDLAPVGRHAPGGGGGAQVERLNRQKGFVPGNLVVMGHRAAEARAGGGFRQAIERLERLEAEREPGYGGLTTSAWARLAVLESFAVPLAHDEAARLPLLLLPPPRVPVANPAQALQVMLTVQLTEPGYARRLAAAAARVETARSRQALQVFLHTLLARRVALGRVSPIELRHGLEDAWRHPLVNQRWQAFALSLTPSACDRLVAFGVEQCRAEGNGHPRVAMSSH